MNCPNDAILRTHLDDELSGADLADVTQHLASCAACRQRFEEMANQKSRVNDALARLPNACDTTDPAVAYARFRAELASELEAQPSFVSRLFAPRWRPAWGVVTAVCVIGVVLSFGPARSWAQRILAMLRVQKITVVSIDPSTLVTGMDNDQRPYKLLNQFISNNVVVTMDPGKPRMVSSVTAAAELAGFRVRTIGSLGTPAAVQVNGEAAFHMNLDRTRMTAILEEVGRSDIQLAESIDGATVAVHIPKAVLSMYGTCPVRHIYWNSPGQPSDIEKMAERKREMLAETAKDTNCVYFLQSPSPTVSVPPNLNMSEIAEAGLELAGMSASEAHSFCQTVDWSSTLVIPVPRNSSSYQTAKVDGVEGTLVTEIMPDANRYGLMWVKNGVIYSLVGRGDPSNALNLAASLK